MQGLSDGYQNHLLVAGVHGTGKTFYLHKLVEIAKSDNVIGAIVDCPEKEPLEQAKSILSKTIREFQSQINNPSYSNALFEDFEAKDKSKFFSLPKRNYLASEDIEYDFKYLVQKAKDSGSKGIVICIDEGQRSNRELLSVLKNSLSKVQGVLIVLSWRLSSDTKGAARQAIEELTQRMVDTEKDKDIGAVAFFSSQTGLGPFKTDDEIKAYFKARLNGNSIQFSEDSSLRLGEITNRVPRAITTLAHYVYDTARKENATC